MKYDGQLNLRKKCALAKPQLRVLSFPSKALPNNSATKACGVEWKAIPVCNSSSGKDAAAKYFSNGAKSFSFAVTDQ